MELVEGEDLAQRIARGAIPLDEALPIAKQIAEALEAAHEQGIIHRDLKPANIKVRPDGTVKVLDFGLAKALDPLGLVARRRRSRKSPTITTPAMMTGVGVILGTAAYMSPEQARGQAVDKRSDIWAFGCVLYEMLTGKRAFDGEDVTDTLAAVCTRGAGLDSAARRTRRRRFGDCSRRCLEKDRKRRLADAADARLEIEDALSPRRRRRPVHPARLRAARRLRLARALPWASAAALAAGLAVVLVLWAPWRKRVTAGAGAAERRTGRGRVAGGRCRSRHEPLAGRHACSRSSRRRARGHGPSSTSGGSTSCRPRRCRGPTTRAVRSFRPTASGSGSSRTAS